MLSAVAGYFLLETRTKQFNLLFVHYRRAVLNSAPVLQKDALVLKIIFTS